MSDEPNKEDRKSKPGPDAERFKIEGVEWEDAVKNAMHKKKPDGGWPDHSAGGDDNDDEAE
ncbi:MAG: hypothetical protein GC159_15845 [Phycisphaera sp.]|nr:hypothetical protein [Phycisphaera sp.]